MDPLLWKELSAAQQRRYIWHAATTPKTTSQAGHQTTTAESAYISEHEISGNSKGASSSAAVSKYVQRTSYGENKEAGFHSFSLPARGNSKDSSSSAAAFDDYKSVDDAQATTVAKGTHIRDFDGEDKEADRCEMQHDVEDNKPPIVLRMAAKDSSSSAAFSETNKLESADIHLDNELDRDIAVRLNTVETFLRRMFLNGTCSSKLRRKRNCAMHVRPDGTRLDCHARSPPSKSSETKVREHEQDRDLQCGTEHR